MTLSPNWNQRFVITIQTNHKCSKVPVSQNGSSPITLDFQKTKESQTEKHKLPGEQDPLLSVSGDVWLYLSLSFCK